MKILFCLPGYIEKNFRLQPWLTLHELGKGFSKTGHDVFAISDTETNEIIDGISVHSVNSLRGTNNAEVLSLLEKIGPDAAIVSVTPLSLATSGWYRYLKDIRSYAFLSYPFYNAKEILKAMPYLGNNDKWSYGRHLLVPKILWQTCLRKFFSGVFCQSHRTGERVSVKGVFDFSINVIPPGIDKDLWIKSDSPRPNKTETVFLYTGGIYDIRGFSILIDAFEDCNLNDAELVILARGADEKTISRIMSEKVKKNLRNRVLIKGGWIDQVELKRHIENATIVILPFVLVPSELPVTVLEVIACGTPAIVSDIDGLPEAAGNAGIVVPPSNSSALAAAMKRVHHNKNLQESLRTACQERSSHILSWAQVCDEWLEVIKA